MKDLIERAKKVKLIAFDVDGVLTDGTITYTNEGIEIKSFNAKDGQGVNLLNHYGYTTAIITARESKIVERRAKDLGISYVFQGAKNKLQILDDLIKELGITYEEVAYMGDDLPDLRVLEKVGLPTCPNDAVKPVKNVAKFIAEKNGGRGAVRELADFIIYS